jgi:integrase/recombinase XerC
MRAERLARVAVPGSAESMLAAGVAFLAPEEAVLEAMLAGWVTQQTSRLLALTTIEQRVLLVRRLVKFSNDYPWNWTASDVEEWTTALVGRGLAHSTLRNYQMSVQLFCGYVTDRRYGWDVVCEQRFGTHPVQVFHEWNSAAHRDANEARPGNRPLSRKELQTFFDYCDERVATVTKTGRKGWHAAFRDAVLFKTVYAFGLRRREATMLEVADLSANPHAQQFGRYGAISVRYGKAMKGSPPRRRTVLTTMGWSAHTLAEWVEEIRPGYGTASTSLWPTERGAAISTDHLNTRFAAYRDACGLPALLGPHCLRHSYISHLLEDGYDHLFVQMQAGHTSGSSTAGYTTVGSDYKNDALRRALNRAFTDPTDPAAG